MTEVDSQHNVTYVTTTIQCGERKKERKENKTKQKTTQKQTKKKTSAIQDLNPRPSIF